ncbi:MAG TPA: dihydrolipoamide acetyltransferase family protein [Roseiflexaceae bacterium]|nr:dihydrolipoamide acetyltransferase family protein [Roseiflexaceae bacterium]
MPTEIKMPKLGESVVEGTISRWLKKPGDRVALYEPLLEVQTDKVDTEVPAPMAGVVREITVPEGATVKVGTLIAILDDGEAAADDAGPKPDDGAGAASAQAPPDTQPSALSPQPSKFISPVVARMAQEHGIDLSRIKGTGLGGRVSKKDVERYLAERAKAPAPEALPAEVAISAPAAPPTPARPVEPAEPPLGRIDLGVAAPPPTQLPADVEILPISPMRRAIAEHMERSVRTAPHVTTVFEADLGRVLAHRERERAAFERQGARLTLTPYFIQAAVAGLRAAPIVNSTWTAEGIAHHRRVHVGIAVALDEGLIVPVVRDADEKSLLGLARSVNDLSERARTHRLQPGETQGGTFTITNHGVSGSLFATPIINQPQSAILGVGAVQKRAVVVSQGGVDSIAIRPMCYLSLTFDHRLIDGAVADAFLAEVKRFLEHYGA